MILRQSQTGQALERDVNLLPRVQLLWLAWALLTAGRVLFIKKRGKIFGNEAECFLAVP